MQHIFNKEEFKKTVVYNVKNLYRRNVDEASQQQLFNAVAYTVKDLIMDGWIATHNQILNRVGHGIEQLLLGRFVHVSPVQIFYVVDNGFFEFFFVKNMLHIVLLLEFHL